MNAVSAYAPVNQRSSRIRLVRSATNTPGALSAMSKLWDQGAHPIMQVM
jgi:hypothetical protein